MCGKFGARARRILTMRSRRSKRGRRDGDGDGAGGGAVKVKEESVAARKVRTRIRRPRYVSLTRLDRKAEEADKAVDERDEMEMRLIELFPMRAAAGSAAVSAAVSVAVSAAEEVSRISEYFFSEECDTSTSLTGLLDSEAVSVPATLAPSPLAAEREARAVEGAETDEKLVKAALRGREREESEEKWVSYSEVVEDVSSSAVDGCGPAAEEKRGMKRKRLSLKLDYKEVLDAWDGGRSLFVGHGDGSQIVPGFDDDEIFGGDSNVAWSVPNQNAKKVVIKEEEIVGSLEEEELKWKMGRIREASLLRYKEKRQNRLFSKRIRYEVRKLNAEKRPRIKGRFVKRD
uniref:CCT domain-containing protein n=1 Tax=Kalanchoe fedtschenkoi TaxID=63787 RepID=A0A7N0TR26_KALFE